MQPTTVMPGAKRRPAHHRHHHHHQHQQQQQQGREKKEEEEGGHAGPHHLPDAGGHKAAAFGLRAVGGLAVRPAPMRHLNCLGTLGRRAQVILVQRPVPRHNVVYFPVRTPAFFIHDFGECRMVIGC